jgi:hypothetical protein
MSEMNGNSSGQSMRQEVQEKCNIDCMQELSDEDEEIGVG